MNDCYIKKIAVFSLSLWIGACSSQYGSQGDLRYLQSRNSVPIHVPPPLTDNNLSHFYDLPLQTQDPRVNLAPP